MRLTIDEEPVHQSAAGVYNLVACKRVEFPLKSRYFFPPESRQYQVIESENQYPQPFQNLSPNQPSKLENPALGSMEIPAGFAFQKKSHGSGQTVPAGAELDIPMGFVMFKERKAGA